MKLSKYQSVQDILNAVCSSSDVEALKVYVAATTDATDSEVNSHLVACKEVLNIHEQGFYKRWSTPFLQEKVEECRRDPSSRLTPVYESEIRRRGHDRY